MVTKVNDPNIQNGRDDIEKLEPEPINEDLEIVEKKPVGKFHREALGTSGTMIFGMIFDEEYLSKLSGFRRADIFDEILRSDDIVTMLLTARKNPILKATWTIDPAVGDSPEEEEKFKLHADLVSHELFERMDKDFKDLLEEKLSFVEQGYALFERVHEVVNDPKFGQYIGYKNIAWRSQRTIERWTLQRDGKIASVFQQADGDLNAHVDIPGEWVTVFSLRKKGDNYEGISALRPIYGNWQRKNKFLKLLAIGIERYAINTPIGKIPAGKEESSERKVFINMLRQISSHQKNYIVLPEGWEVEFLKNPFDVDKVVKAIVREDDGMIKSFVANHLTLGKGGGSYALGSDLSDQFLSIIENDADIIARGINKSYIKELVDFNFGKQSKYPKIKVSGINDKFGKEFADIVDKLSANKFLTPTENLEVDFRKRLGLPELLEADKALIDDVRTTDPKPEPQFSEKKSNIVAFADLRKTKATINSQLTTSAKLVSEAMAKELDKRTIDLIDNIGNRMARVKPSEWRRVLRTQEKLQASQEYQRGLKKALTEVAGRAINQARNEVPGGRKIKVFENIKGRMSYQLVDDSFKNLPPKTRELILTDSKLAVDSQFTSISNAVIFQANSAVDETEDINVIKKRMSEEKDRRIQGQGKTGINGAIVTAGADLTAKSYNTARIEFFQVPEVLEKIEAFQFQNTDPKSPICQDLNGTIFKKDDPESDRYLPPLHHNCKSFIVPLFDLQGKSVSDTGLTPSNPTLNKFVTL